MDRPTSAAVPQGYSDRETAGNYYATDFLTSQNSGEGFEH